LKSKTVLIDVKFDIGEPYKDIIVVLMAQVLSSDVRLRNAVGDTDPSCPK